MSEPLTVGELIDQLNHYPKDAPAEISLRFEIKTKIGNNNEESNYSIVEGKVYGVNGWIGNKNKVVQITGG